MEVELIGQDGNAFAIIASVPNALRRAGYVDEATEWTQDAIACGSFDELLRLATSTVEVV